MKPHKYAAPELSDWLVLNRDRLGLSQCELAEQAGMSRAMLDRLENCRNGTTLRTIQSLCDVFGEPFVVEPSRDGEVGQ